MSLVALHGFTGSGRDFDPLRERLGLPVRSLDLLGHGEAGAPMDGVLYSMERQVQRIVNQVPDDPFVLLGYSMGGRVALRLWPHVKSRVKGLILIGSTPGLKMPVERVERMAKDWALAGEIESKGGAWFVDHWSQLPMIRSQQRIPSAILTSMQRRRQQNRAIGLANTLRGIGQGAVESVWSTLSSIDVPTLLLTGSEDLKYTAIAEEMMRGFTHASHRIVEGAGHCVHLEAMDESVTLIREFVAGVSG